MPHRPRRRQPPIKMNGSDGRSPCPFCPLAQGDNRVDPLHTSWRRVSYIHNRLLGAVMGDNFNDDVRNTVSSLLTTANRVPFLFVGSGISRRYMGTEDWEGLLKWVCESVSTPMKPFYLYRQLAAGDEDSRKNALYPRIATLMENDFITTKRKAHPRSHRHQPLTPKRRSPTNQRGHHSHRTQTTRDSPKPNYSLTQKRTKAPRPPQRTDYELHPT